MENILDEARKIINEVDSQMADLFVKRMRAAEMVYEYKKKMGLPILDSERERAVIEKNTALIEDDILKNYYIDYIKNVMSLSRAYQYRMQTGLKVAYHSEENTFAHVAVERIFPESQKIPYKNFKAAYDAVVNGETDVAILSIENSYDIEVDQTMELIFSGPLFMNGIYELRIPQTLPDSPEAAIEDINKTNENISRFAVLSREQANSPDFSNFIFMFTLKNEADSPATVVNIIEKYGYHTTALQSRLLKKDAGQYYFYIEINGSTDTMNGKQLLNELNQVCEHLKVVGTFAPHVEI